jgi:DNA-binding transcriptional regulator LsrR (DeoR family)
MTRRKTPATQPDPADDVVIDTELTLRVSRMYYVEDLTKSQIGERLGISRFKVARLIDAARERGIVRIYFVDQTSTHARLERELCERFGLRRATVVGTTPGNDLKAVGSACADIVLEELRAGYLLGIGWGSTVYEVVTALQTRQATMEVDVIQLAGGVSGVDLSLNAIGLASSLAQTFGGRFYPVHAPAFVDSDQAFTTLLEEEVLARTFRLFPDIDIAITGIGDWTGGPPSALRRSRALSSKTVKSLLDQQTCADVLSHFVDSAGRLIEDAPHAVGPTVDDIHAIDLRIGVAAGEEKAAAIEAALRSGLLNGVVTDEAAATRILRGST